MCLRERETVTETERGGGRERRGERRRERDTGTDTESINVVEDGNYQACRSLCSGLFQLFSHVG